MCREGSGYKCLEWSKQVLGRLSEESAVLILCCLSLTPPGGTSAGEAVSSVWGETSPPPWAAAAASSVGRVPREQKWVWVSAVGAGGPSLSQGGRWCRSSACWSDSGSKSWCDFCLKVASLGSDVRQEAHLGTAVMVSLLAARLSLSGWLSCCRTAQLSAQWLSQFAALDIKVTWNWNCFTLIHWAVTCGSTAAVRAADTFSKKRAEDTVWDRTQCSCSKVSHCCCWIQTRKASLCAQITLAIVNNV